MDCSLPGSSAHEISQARIQAWVAISFPKEYSKLNSIAEKKVGCVVDNSQV